MTRRGRYRLVLFIALLTVSAMAGPVYVWISLPDGAAAGWHSAIDGIVGGILLWGGMLFIWPSRRLAPLRRQAFPLRLAILCSCAGLVTATAAVLSFYRLTGRWSWAGLSWSLFAYVIGVVLAVLVVLQVIRMIGPMALANVLLGRYHNPVMDKRVFLFIDLVGSTALARQLGDLGLQRLISRFVFDLTAPVQECGGEIHAYVGDGVIVTWPFDKGVRKGNCLRCFFAIRDCLAGREAAYRAAFHAVPEIRGGLHGGSVVVSEIGDIKTAVVYFGDTVNTAARLEDAAKRHGKGLVVSGELLRSMEVPGDLAAKKMGTETLRGHDSPTELVAVTRRTADTVS